MGSNLVFKIRAVHEVQPHVVPQRPGVLAELDFDQVAVALWRGDCNVRLQLLWMRSMVPHYAIGSLHP